MISNVNSSKTVYSIFIKICVIPFVSRQIYFMCAKLYMCNKIYALAISVLIINKTKKTACSFTISYISSRMFLSISHMRLSGLTSLENNRKSYHLEILYIKPEYYVYDQI